MKIEELFEKILQRAIDNGWDICGFLSPANCNSWSKGIHQWQNVVDLEIYYSGHKRVIQANTIFFNHDFARAFFGEEKEHMSYPDLTDGSYLGPIWEKHLMLMAIEENPIEYLRKFI